MYSISGIIRLFLVLPQSNWIVNTLAKLSDPCPLMKRPSLVRYTQIEDVVVRNRF